MSLADGARFDPLRPVLVAPRGRTAAQAAMTGVTGLVERAFLFFLFCVYCYAFLPAVRFFGDEDAPTLGESDPTNQRVQFLILIVMSCLLIAYRRQLLALLPALKGPIILTVLCYVSFLWSDDPLLSLKRAVVLTMTGLTGVYAYRRFTFDQIARVGSVAALFMAGASLVTIVLVPRIGLDNFGLNAGLPRGVFSNKNSLGFMMLLISFFPFWMLAGGGRSTVRPAGWFYYAGVWVVCAGLAVASRSGTVLAAMVIGYASWAFASVVRRYPQYRLPFAYMAAAGALIALTLVALYPDQALGLLGKDEGLTGRDMVWKLSWMYIKARPLLGYGYAAFWVEDSINTQTIWEILQWNPPTAHNAALGIMLELGVVGLVFCLAFYAVLFRRTIGAVWRATDARMSPMLALLMTMFAQSFSEANILHQGDINWMLTIIIALTVAEIDGRVRVGSEGPAERRGFRPGSLAPAGAA